MTMLCPHNATNQQTQHLDCLGTMALFRTGEGLHQDLVYGTIAPMGIAHGLAPD